MTNDVYYSHSYHRGTLIEQKDGNIKIRVNGKSINPKSKEGKAILKESNEKIKSLDAVFEPIVEKIKEIFEK